MSALVILPLHTRAPSNGIGGGGNGLICIVGLSTVHLPSTILHGTPITLLMASLSHLSCCSNLLTSRALNSPSAVTTKHSALLFLSPSHTPNLYLGSILFNGSDDIGLASTFSSHGTNSCVGFLPCSLSNGVRPSRPFWHLHKMLPACSTNHGKIGVSSRSSSCVQIYTWHLTVLMTPRNNIIAFSFEGLKVCLI